MKPKKIISTHNYSIGVRDSKIQKLCRELRIAREISGLTQLKLAEKIGKHRNVITKIETEGGNITLKTLFDIIEGGLGGKVEIKITLED